MNHVFIPSRGRYQNARQLTDVWHEHGFEVHWVVEPNEHHMYFDELPEDASLHPLQHKNLGIAYARYHCVNLAASYGFRAIIMADDDIKPGKLGKANMTGLVEAAKHSKVLGITARYGYHDLCLGDKIRDRSDLILLPTGTFRLVALNIHNVLSVGNYDRSLEYAEDCDLFLRGLKHGFPWMVHLGTWANSMGNRYEPGGMLAYAGGEGPLKTKKQQWHEDLYARYPEFVNHPAKADFTKQNSIRISWKKAYNSMLPGWQEWSALHGGYLARYLGLVRNGQ